MPERWWLIALAGYGVMSTVSFFVFGLDKRAAARERRRIPERTLHLLEALGGWPGALLAMPMVRHKGRKLCYVAVTLLIALAHVGAWIALMMQLAERR